MRTGPTSPARRPDGCGASPSFARLLAATVAYAAGDHVAARVFHWLFACLLLWIATLPILSLWSAVLVPRWAFAIVALALLGGILLLARQLRDADPIAARAGYVWAAAVAGLLAAYFAIGREVLQPGRPGGLGAHLQAIVALALPGLLLAALFLGRGKATAGTHASRIGLLALGSAVITGVIAVLLWANLLAASTLIGAYPDIASQEAFDDWNKAYAAALPYQIAPAEAVTTWATGAVGLALLAGILLFLAATWIPWLAGRVAGRFAASDRREAVRASVESRLANRLPTGVMLRHWVRLITILIIPIYLAVGGLIAIEIADRLECAAAPDWFVAAAHLGGRDAAMGLIPPPAPPSFRPAPISWRSTATRRSACCLSSACSPWPRCAGRSTSAPTSSSISTTPNPSAAGCARCSMPCATTAISRLSPTARARAPRSTPSPLIRSSCGQEARRCWRPPARPSPRFMDAFSERRTSPRNSAPGPGRTSGGRAISSAARFPPRSRVLERAWRLQTGGSSTTTA